MLFADAIKAWASALDPRPDPSTMRLVRKVWAAARTTNGGMRPVAEFTQSDLREIVAGFQPEQQPWVEQMLLSVGRWAAQQPAGAGDPRAARSGQSGGTVLLALGALVALIVVAAVGYRALTGGDDAEESATADYCTNASQWMDSRPLIPAGQFVQTELLIDEGAAYYERAFQVSPAEIRADLELLLNDTYALQEVAQTTGANPFDSAFSEAVALRIDETANSAAKARVDAWTLENCGVDLNASVFDIEPGEVADLQAKQQCFDALGDAFESRLINESELWDQEVCGTTAREFFAREALTQERMRCLAQAGPDVDDDRFPDIESTIWDDPTCGPELEAYIRDLYGIDIQALRADAGAGTGG